MTFDPDAAAALFEREMVAKSPARPSAAATRPAGTRRNTEVDTLNIAGASILAAEDHLKKTLADPAVVAAFREMMNSGSQLTPRKQATKTCAWRTTPLSMTLSVMPA
jgi:hypothetical protein